MGVKDWVSGQWGISWYSKKNATVKQVIIIKVTYNNGRGRVFHCDCFHSARFTSITVSGEASTKPLPLTEERRGWPAGEQTYLLLGHILHQDPPRLKDQEPDQFYWNHRERQFPVLTDHWWQQYRSTLLGRDKWKTVVGPDACLQLTCNKEGFNEECTMSDSSKARIGILGNEDGDRVWHWRGLWRLYY